MTYLCYCSLFVYILFEPTQYIQYIRLKVSRRYAKSSPRGRNVSFYAKFPLNLPPVTKRPLDSPEKNGFFPVALIETIWLFYCLIFQTCVFMYWELTSHSLVRWIRFWWTETVFSIRVFSQKYLTSDF